MAKTIAGTNRNEAMVDLYREMVRIRYFEEQVQKSYLDGLVHGTTHLCQGQEAVPVGLISNLRPDDYLTYTYRGHGVCVARGMDMKAALSEIFGRVDGASGGLGGSMHITDPKIGLIGSFGIVGGGLPCAVGAGLAAKMDGKSQVSVTFFGDGSTNIGSFHESLNMAAIWKLPVIFVCENNLYGEFSRINHTTPIEDIAVRAGSYGMPGEVVDGNDVEAVSAVATKAIERARSGEGPTLIEAKTYRHRGHSRTDPAKYRPEDEVKEWLARDPIIRFRKVIVEGGHADKSDLDAIDEAARAEAAEAAEQANASAWPEPQDRMDVAFANPSN